MTRSAGSLSRRRRLALPPWSWKGAGGRGGGLPAKPVCEACVGGVDVEENDALVVREAKAVLGAGWRGNERAGLRSSREELDVSAEHEERIDMVVVRVRVNSRPARLEGERDRRQVGRLAEDGERVRGPLRSLPLSGARDNDGFRRPAAVLGWIDAVESRCETPHVVGEASARCVEVEERRSLGTPAVEAVDDPGWNGDEGPCGCLDRAQLGTDPERELTVEHVERVGVPAVHVWRRAGLEWPVARPCDVEQAVREEDPDGVLGAVVDGFSFART